MAYCSNCGSKLDDGTKFCPNCGSKVSVKSADTADNDESAAKEPTSLLGAFIQGCKEGWNEDLDEEKKSGGGDSDQESSKKSGCWRNIIIGIVILAVIGFFSKQCGGKKDSETTKESSTEQIIENSEVQEEVTNEQVQTVSDENRPLIGSKDLEFVKNKIKGTTWTYTDEINNIYWTKLVFEDGVCKVYGAMPRDGEWSYKYESPYEVTEKRLDDGKRYVFVYIKYDKDGEEALHPLGINVTEGSFIYGALGAIGYIQDKDYVWD